jgi:23S rRNA (cytosine1962-C5)-methyltransferase
MANGPTSSSPSGAPSPQRLRLRVSPAAESAIRSGHPWVFGDSLRQQNRDGVLGELAVIYDRQDRFLAIGLFDPDSPLRVRILHAGKPVTLDAAWWQTHLKAAVDRRAGLFSDDTNGFRWIYGESDGWPGLALDRYADTLVLKLYTAAWLPRLKEVVSLLDAEFHPARLVLRLSRNIQAKAAEFGWSDGTFLLPTATEANSEVRDPISIFSETGIRFEAEVVRGQKTGFFLDQRENRRLVEQRAQGKTVLNGFSFSGGFSLYAARGGARTVTDLDISAHALESARRNFGLNQAVPAIQACRHDSVQSDAFEWLARGPKASFDIVILDPPSLARREAERTGAIEAYGKLAESGIARVNPGGMLVAGSCSAHVSAEEFFDTVRRAAQRSRRQFREWRTMGHPPDHAARFKEAEYLKCLYLEF